MGRRQPSRPFRDMSFRHNFSILSTDRELGVSRVIGASPDQVFSAWTRHLPEWWGPHGTTTPRCEMDLRPGGIFRTTLRAQDGTECSTHGIFLEVRRPSLIVFTDAFQSAWYPQPQAFSTGVIRFDPLPEGATVCTVHALHWSAAAREKHAQMGFDQVWNESLDRLAEVVTKYFCPSPISP